MQLENGKLSIVVRPDLGGRIDQITDLTSGKVWLWHPPGYDAEHTRALPLGASFDQNWSGGWDEVFPNDAAGVFRGHSLVDHGELWSQHWEVMEHSDHGIRMSYLCRTLPISVEKSLALDAHLPRVRVGYSFRNLSGGTLPYLFKLHTAVNIQEGDEILMPPCWMEPVELGFSRIIGRSGKTRFPKAHGADGQDVRLDRVPPRSSQSREFVYCTRLQTGQCGIGDPKAGTAFMLRFELQQLPSVWLFQSYGGWMDHYVLVIEPCTNIPYDLETALSGGTCAVLAPWGRNEVSIVMSIERFPS